MEGESPDVTPSFDHAWAKLATTSSKNCFFLGFPKAMVEKMTVGGKWRSRVEREDRALGLPPSLVTPRSRLGSIGVADCVLRYLAGFQEEEKEMLKKELEECWGRPEVELNK